jgi:hypothetical protein
VAKTSEPYVYFTAESYRDKDTGSVGLRPALSHPFPQSLHIIKGCKICAGYPVGTTFRLKVKLTDVNGQKGYLYTS